MAGSVIVAPGLILVTGPAGAGKTALAHRLAVDVGCPAVCRDEIKEGLVLTEGTSDAVSNATATAVFTDVLRVLIEHRVTVVAEAAFQHAVWCSILGQLDGLAEVAVIRCQVDPDVVRARLQSRSSRAAHDDEQLLADLDRYLADFEHLSLDVPTLDVNTTAELTPELGELADFVRGALSSES